MKYYVHVKAGSDAKPGSLVGRFALRADYIRLPSGDTIGVLERPSDSCRAQLEAMNGVTVLLHPANPKPLPPEHVALIAHAGVVAGDTMWEAGEKLAAHHQLPWFHPEFVSQIR